MTQQQTAHIQAALEPIAKAHGVSSESLANSFCMRASLQADATGISLEATQKDLLARMQRGFDALQNGTKPNPSPRLGFVARFASRQAEQALAGQQR